MSQANVITFLCPSCNTRLTVAGELAGVVGPCPHCQVLIRASYPAPQPPLQAAATYSNPPQEASHHPHPQYQANPLQEAPDYYEPPKPQPQYQNREPQAPQGQPTYLRPAPRQLPDRSEPIKSTTRARIDPSRGTHPRGEPASAPRQRHHRGFFVRALVPLLFLCVAIGVVYGVKTFLQMDPAKNGKNSSMASGGTVAHPVNPNPAPDDTLEVLTGEGAETLPVGDRDMPNIGQSQPEPTSPSTDSGIAAQQLLEEFLKMKSLDERLPHLESKRGEAVLASSVLNAPLPEVFEIKVDIRENDAGENATDHYYHVNFANDDGGINPQTMLVRTRGTAPPKVVVDPFLDLFGGRFAKFAAEPTKEAGTFLVVLSAGTNCYEGIDDVPNPDNKLTMKVMSQADTKEIAKAYFGKNSNIGRMLKDETSGLSYGQIKACTVFMHWNMEEDPERPFLEALKITALNWNP